MEFYSRGKWKSVAHLDPETVMAYQITTILCDKGCWYFIANKKGVNHAKHMYGDHWRKVSETTDSDAENFGLDIDQYRLVNSYNDTYLDILRHNKKH